MSYRDNLKITLRERGKIMAIREGHNIWLERGRIYLAQMLSLVVIDPDFPERSDRIVYVGLGIGGENQSMPGIANVPPMSVSYPGTNLQTNFNPYLTSLERPVRITGGVAAYPGAPGDLWLNDPPATFGPPVLHPTPSDAAFRVTYSGPAGHIAYGPFLAVPLSEIALLTDEAAVTPVGQPFNPIMAYHTFESLQMTPLSEIEITWSVRF